MEEVVKATIENGFIFIPSNNVVEEFKLSKDDLVLTETSLATLMNNVTKPGNFNTVKRQHATQPLVVDQIKITPYKGTKSLLIRTVVRSDSGKKYDNQIMFKRVTFVDDIDQVENEGDIVEFTASDGETYYVEKIDMNKIDVAVRCNCASFRWDFARRNPKDKTLYGSTPAPYKPKTDRPPRNLNNVSGLCKHLMKTGAAIAESEMTTEFKI